MTLTPFAWGTIPWEVIWKAWDIIRGCLTFKKPLLITPHSIFITHHSITHHLSLKISQHPKMACLALVSNFSNSKNFTFCGTHGLTWCSFYFFFLFFFSFLFFLQPPIPKLTKPSWKKKKKKKRVKKTRPNPAWKKEKKKTQIGFNYLHVVVP